MPTQKTQDNTQFARVGELDGTAPAGFNGAPNDGLAPLCDRHGHLYVVQAVPGGAALVAASYYDSAALETSAVILAAAGALVVIYGFNNTAGVLYFQTFDQAGALAGAEIPVGVNLPVQAGGMFSVTLGPYGRDFANGIVFGFSTTPAVYTAAAAGAGWVNAQYRAA